MATWVEYRSHKIVEARPIVAITEKGEGNRERLLWLDTETKEVFIPSEPVMMERAHVGDYAIRYKEGYRSISPKAVFEEGYTAI